MPFKGQTCQTCDGNCCHCIISYKYTPEAEKEVIALVESGKTTWSKKSPMTYSHQELLNWGMVKIISPDTGQRCAFLNKEGKCSRQHHKPRLCRSYWCHGKLWKPKDGSNQEFK